MLTPMFLLVVIGLSALAALACIRRIPEGQAYTVRRFGGHVRAVGAGIHVVLPGFEHITHRIRLLGNVVDIGRIDVGRNGETNDERRSYGGQIYYQVVDAERADAVIDRVDSLLRACLPGPLSVGVDEDVVARNQRIKAELNRQLRDRGILITRVQIADAA